MISSNNIQIKAEEINALSFQVDKIGFKRSVSGESEHLRICRGFLIAKKMNRGLWLSGSCGIGKTVAAKTFSIIQDGIFIDCGNQSNVMSLDQDDRECIEIILQRPLVIDDMGAEKPINKYGIQCEVVGEFISLLYAKRDRIVGVPIVTTNLTANDVGSRYGQRIISRIKELFVVCPLQGEDKRQIIKV